VYSADEASDLHTFTDATTQKVPFSVPGLRVKSAVADPDTVGVAKDVQQVVVRTHTDMDVSQRTRLRSVLKDCVPSVFTPNVAMKGRLYYID
jgi:hypothetical protein